MIIPVASGTRHLIWEAWPALEPLLVRAFYGIGEMLVSNPKMSETRMSHKF